MISSTITGASPSDSSSIIIRSGSLISPRAIAHICCSPPDMLPATWLSRSPSAREQLHDAVDVAVVGPPAAESQVVPDGEPGEQSAALRHVRDAEVDDLLDRPSAELPARGRSRRPARIGDHPGQRPQQGGLAGAVRPDQRDDLLLPDRQVDVPQHLHPAVAGGQAGAPQASGDTARCRFTYRWPR